MWLFIKVVAFEDAGLLEDYADDWCDMLVGMSRISRNRISD